MTLIHGDFNCGNVWNSRAPDGGFLFADFQLTQMGPIGFDFLTMFMLSDKDQVEQGKLFADFQLTQMGPIGFDFLTMFMLSDKDQVEQGKAIALMRKYHAALPAQIQAEYPLSQMYDDTRLLLAP
eukprot:gene17061-19664_t